MRPVIVIYRGPQLLYDSGNEAFLDFFAGATGSDAPPAPGIPYQELFPASVTPGGIERSRSAALKAMQTGDKVTLMMPSPADLPPVPVTFVPLFEPDGSVWGVAAHWMDDRHPETRQRRLQLLRQPA